mmetsp:Transcript_28188/g.38767  ORF Transcript_28188/g.38767 Transcript_28188/m.38767 type:complete len:458 (-) Transcript_28188:19-1392(-)
MLPSSLSSSSASSKLVLLLIHAILCNYSISSFSYKTSIPSFCNSKRNFNRDLKLDTRQKIPRHNFNTELSLSITPYLPILGSALSVAGVVAFHEAGHFFAARWQGIKVVSYNIGYGPKILSFNDTKTEVEFALRAVPLGGYVAFPQNLIFNDEGDVIGEKDDPNLLQNRPPLQRALVISAGVLANILLTFILSFGTAFTTGIGSPVYNDGVVVTTIASPTSPGRMAGLKVDDVIIKVNGEQLTGSDVLIEKFISKVRTSKDVALPIEVIRNKEIIRTTVVPRANANGKASIGIGINANIKQINKAVATNPIEATKLAAEETIRLIQFTFNAFVRAISTGFSGNDVGGPIAVVKAGAKMAEYSPSALVGFAAMLSVNLAVLNSFPFPALDGGQLVFVLVELLSGKAVKREVRDFITGIAFLVLLSVGATTIIGDIDKQLNDPISVMMDSKSIYDNTKK